MGKDDGFHTQRVIACGRIKQRRISQSGQIHGTRRFRIIGAEIDQNGQTGSEAGIVVIQNDRVTRSQDNGRGQLRQGPVHHPSRIGGLGGVHGIVRPGGGKRQEEARKQAAAQ